MASANGDLGRLYPASHSFLPTAIEPVEIQELIQHQPLERVCYGGDPTKPTQYRRDGRVAGHEPSHGAEDENDDQGAGVGCDLLLVEGAEETAEGLADAFEGK